jgi:hypothetical protein
VSPATSRNLTNVAIYVGLVPVLFWLRVMALVIFAPDELLPWTVAASGGVGAFFCIISLLIVGPAMVLARNLAAENPILWTPIHRAPLKIGLIVFLLAVSVGIWLMLHNIYSRPPASTDVQLTSSIAISKNA